MTKFDKIIISISVFAFTFIWISYFSDNIAVAIFTALLITILILTIGLHILNRKKNTSRINAHEMENMLALYGNDYQVSLLNKAIPKYFDPTPIENGVLFTQNLQKQAVFINYKYSTTTPEDLARFYRLAKKNEASKIYILSRPCPRNVLVLAASLDIEFSFVTSRQFHKHLYKQNLLMEKIKPIKTKRQRRQFSDVLWEIFQKRRAKYFFMSAITFGLFLLITPFKLYYLIMLSIVLCLGVICLFRPA
ncbi:MAG: hypothetical protein GX242_05905 [Clostridiales bacterium]|nr:hypothetical protein [Clostridiales bacterium]